MLLSYSLVYRGLIACVYSFILVKTEGLTFYDIPQTIEVPTYINFNLFVLILCRY